MDETKTSQQDNPTTETPSGDKGTTPEKEPETLEEQVAHIKEVAFADVGRYRVATEKATREAETAKKSANAAEARLTQFIKDQEEAELEGHRDEPDKLTVIRERQARRGVESELAKTKQELSEKDERIKQFDEKEVESTKERNAREIAARLNVDAKLLAELAKLTDGSSEAIEEKAKLLPKKGEAKTLKPDAGKTIGGAKTYKRDETLSTLDPSTMTPQQIHEQVLELEKAEKEGRVK